MSSIYKMCEKFPHYLLYSLLFFHYCPSETKQKTHNCLVRFGLEVAFQSKEQKEEKKKPKSLPLPKTCIHKELSHILFFFLFVRKGASTTFCILHSDQRQSHCIVKRKLPYLRNSWRFAKHNILCRERGREKSFHPSHAWQGKNLCYHFYSLQSEMLTCPYYKSFTVGKV